MPYQRPLAIGRFSIFVVQLPATVVLSRAQSLISTRMTIMRNRVGLSGGWPCGSLQRGRRRVRGRTALGAALGITAGLAMLEAPPVLAAAATCEEPTLATPALQRQ